MKKEAVLLTVSDGNGAGAFQTKPYKQPGRNFAAAMDNNTKTYLNSWLKTTPALSGAMRAIRSTGASTAGRQTQYG